MAAISLAPPMKSCDRHKHQRQEDHERKRPSPSVSPSTSPLHRSSSPKPRPSSPRPNNHAPYYHYPPPTVTNFPTSPYHRPPSPKYPSSPKYSLSPLHTRKFNGRLSPKMFPSSPEHGIVVTKPSPKYTGASSKSLQCALCLKNYQDPRILPCLHSFCAACLDGSCVQKGDKVDSVYCPICMDTSELPSKGVWGLPKNSYVEHLQFLQHSSNPPSPSATSAFSFSFTSPPEFPVTCDLCVSRDPAVRYCEKCDCNLCEFCMQAHQKQRKTSLHLLLDLEQNGGPCGGARATSRTSLSSRREQRKALYCEVHSFERVELYCRDCKAPICDQCALQSPDGKHTGHSFHSLEEANAQYLELLQDLLSRAKPLARSIKDSIGNIELVATGIQERSEVVSEEIIEFVSSHMTALQEHKRSLLLQLDAIKKQKESTLSVQMAQLKETLTQLNSNCELVARVIGEGTPLAAFSSQTPAASKLEELLATNPPSTSPPKEDDYIQFLPHIQLTEERSGFSMFGVLDPRGPSAANTTVEGDGVYSAKVNKMSQFKVVVFDRYKQRREMGGDRVEVTMVTGGSDRKAVSMFIDDNKDGSYTVSYTPDFSGEYKLFVLVEGKNIRGSPFLVTVGESGSSNGRGLRQGQHQGVFHCCSFCSSNGRKHGSRCGCGGTMPGGYSGCGHGHPGHPGRKHWSCCGSTVENSNCLF